MATVATVSVTEPTLTLGGSVLGSGAEDNKELSQSPGLDSNFDRKPLRRQKRRGTWVVDSTAKLLDQMTDIALLGGAGLGALLTASLGGLFWLNWILGFLFVSIILVCMMPKSQTK